MSASLRRLARLVGLVPSRHGRPADAVKIRITASGWTGPAADGEAGR